MRRLRKYYTPSQAAELLGRDVELIQELIDIEIIRPVRRRGNLVLPVEQVERAKVAFTLLDDLGVNMPGVEVALHMRERLIRQQEQVLKLLQEMFERFEREMDRVEKGMDRMVLDHDEDR